MATDRTIGIDLGTTNSCAAYVADGKAQIIQSKMGYATIPSVVTFDDRGDAVVGQVAERRMVLQPYNTIYGSKRLLGRTYLKSTIDRFQSQFRYKLVADEDGFIAAEIFGRVLPLVEISSLILREIRRSAQRILGESVSRAVITVPAYFTENQRTLVREAGRMADLEVIRIINEPTAAALAFGSGTEKQRLLVFDLGGGTFDVSIVEVCNFVYTVLGVGGDTFLGGIDIDRRLADLVLDRLSSRIGAKILLDATNTVRLRQAAQNAKHQLSVQQVTFIQIPQLLLSNGSTIDINEKITRTELETVSKDICEQTIAVVEDVLETANMKPSDINEVLMVGGQSRMPVLHERLKAFFGFEPNKRVHPDEVVALGAAIAAESGSGADAPVLLDVLPVTLGVAASDGDFQPLILKNTPVPHDMSVTIVVQPGGEALRLAVFQGDGTRVDENEYLGTLEITGLEAATHPVDCILQLKLNSECILKVRASIKELGIEQEIKLATHIAAKHGEEETDGRRIEIRVPKELRVMHSPPKTKPVAAGMKNPSFTPPPTGGFRMMQDDPNWFRRMVDRLTGK